MEPEQALKEIESGKIRPTYLLHGDEYFHVLAIVTALKQRVIQGADGGMSLSEYGGDVGLAQVLDDLRTMTFFGGTRLVIVNNADSFVADNKDALGRYAKSPSNTGCLVLVCSKKPDARWALVKAVQQNGAFVPCITPKPWKLIAWVRTRATVLGKSIGQSAARLLTDIVGADLAQLDSHLQMLVTYVGKRRAITDADVAATVQDEKTVEVWDLMDGIAGKNGKMALEALDRLLPKVGMEAPRLALIGRTLLRLCSVKKMMERYDSDARVVQALNMHPYAAKKNIEQARKFTNEELTFGVRKALEADILIKNGRMKPRLAVEKLIVELCK
ncbi:MAG: DNA polymerase III subunit delta [Planctomycetes bacterium]|nr:DNA polymerase III subunit delta [Planctomycetota bacterium]